MADTTPGTAPVADHRKPPRGVLPRGTQTWLMAGLAIGILAIIVFTGHPEPAPRVAAATAQTLAPNPDRLRDYSDRLRVLDDRSRQQALAQTARGAAPQSEYGEPPPAPVPDPIEADRKRREYESLFSSNVVVSRRPDGQRLSTGAATLPPGGRPRILGDDAPPSLDDVAEAVMRATARSAHATAPTSAIAGAAPDAEARSTAAARGTTRPVATGPITGDGPLHRLLEGTVIDTVLTNRLDGSVAAPSRIRSTRTTGSRC